MFSFISLFGWQWRLNRLLKAKTKQPFEVRVTLSAHGCFGNVQQTVDPLMNRDCRTRFALCKKTDVLG